MSKIRVYELARELGLESKVLIKKLKDAGIEVLSHQSSISTRSVQSFREKLRSEAKPKVVVRRKKKVTKAPREDNSLETSLKTEDAVEKNKTQEKPSERTPSSDRSEVSVDTDFIKKQKIAEVNDKKKEIRAEQGSVLSQGHSVTEEKVKTKDVLSKSLDEGETPEVKTPEVKTPEIKTSEIKTSEVKTFETKTPEVKTSVVNEEESQDNKQKSQPQPSKSGGATIVRRATKEEVDAMVASSNRNRPIRKANQKVKEIKSSPKAEGFLKAKPKEISGFLKKISEHEEQENPPMSNSGIVNRKDSKKKDRSDESSESRLKVIKSKRVQNRNIRDIANFDGDDLPSKSKRRVVFGASGRRKEQKWKKTAHKKTQITTPRASYRVVRMEQPNIAVSDLSKQMSVKSGDVIKKLMGQGLMVSINESIDFDTASLIASEYNFECKVITKTVEDILQQQKHPDVQLSPRSPIITVMGHVDHGKTSILDSIRKSGVADQEAGGITQHIGAYTVEHNGAHIAFLDTPGHEAFSSMRVRGAQLTDIVILVVAADDGVMPQTIEAISHAREAKVPIVVAINKIDKPNINLDRIFNELSEHGIQSEEWGGEHQFVKVSALTGDGIDDLLEAINLQAEMLELQARATGLAEASVIEAHLDKGRGTVATVVVTQGLMKIGQFVVVGKCTGRIRAMNDHNGVSLKEAGPSTPVEILGLTEIPMAGDTLNVVDDEKEAKKIRDIRVDEEVAKNQKVHSAPTDLDETALLENLMGKVKSSSLPQLPLIIKADVQGTMEAICQSIEKLQSNLVKVSVIHKAVGGISESDLNLAETSGAVIIAFNVRASNSITDLADRRSVIIKYFSVIYELVDTVKVLMAGKLPPLGKEVIQGHAEVRNPIHIPKIGLVAGSAVIDGRISRGSFLRLIRDDVVIHDGKMAALKRFKEDVKEVQNGYECGISFESYNDIKVGDVIESYLIEETQAQLDI